MRRSRADSCRSAGRAHRPWPRALLGERLAGGGAPRCSPANAALLGLWGERERRAHGRDRDARRRDCARRSSFACEGEPLPSVGRSHPPAIRLERAMRDLVGLEPDGAAGHAAVARSRPLACRHPLGARRRRPRAPRRLSVPAGGRREPASDPGGTGARRDHRAGPLPLHGERRDGRAPRGAARLRAQGHRGARWPAPRSSARRCSPGACPATARSRAPWPSPGRSRRRSAWRSRRARSGCARCWPSSSGSPITSATSARSATTRRSPSCTRSAACCASRCCGRRTPAFGHRLMMDRVDPRRRPLPTCRKTAQRRVARARRRAFARRFPELVELYDNTASLQDRTVGTGILSPALAEQFAAGGYVGRASGRDVRCATRRRAIAPYDELQFEVPVLEDGDVNARVWIRIREVEQSLALIDAIARRLPAGPICAPAAGARAGRRPRRRGPRRGLPRRRPRVGQDRRPTAGSSAATSATLRGSSGRCSRRRSTATSSPTSRSAISRSTARIRATTSRTNDHAQTAVQEPGARTAHRGRARARTTRPSPSWRRA